MLKCSERSGELPEFFILNFTFYILHFSMWFRLKNFYIAHQRDILTGVLIFLIATLSFGLGYLYAKETTGRTPIVIEKNTESN